MDSMNFPVPFEENEQSLDGEFEYEDCDTDTIQFCESVAEETNHFARRSVDQMLKLGGEWREVRERLGSRKFAPFIRQKTTVPRKTIYHWIQKWEEIYLAISPDTLLQIEEPQTQETSQEEEKDRDIATLTQALEEAEQRTIAIEREYQEAIAHYQQEMERNRAIYRDSTPPIVQRTVERVEVTPRAILLENEALGRQAREAQERVWRLQQEADRVSKQRDQLQRDLAKERSGKMATFLQSQEPIGVTRKRALFKEAMHEIVAWSSMTSMKLPGLADTQVFEAEEWQRLEEAMQAHAVLGEMLRKIKHTVSSPSAEQQSFIVDAKMTTVYE